MTTTAAHPAWCDDHQYDDYGSVDWHESTEHQTVGGLGVQLIDDSSPTVDVRIVDALGADLRIPVADVEALIGALQWAPGHVVVSPLSRAEAAARFLGVEVLYDQLPDVSLLAFVYQTIDEDGTPHDGVVLEVDVDEELKAAGLVFVTALVSVLREHGELLETLKCRNSDGKAVTPEFIAIGRRRLPVPAEPGYERRAADAGRRIGLGEPPVFEIFLREPADVVSA